MLTPFALLRLINHKEKNMQRRDLLKNAGALAGLAVGGSALSQVLPKTATKEKTLAECAAECVATANSCITACLAEAAKGNQNELACVQGCREAAAACGALVTLASTNSQFLKAYAAVCADICRKCMELCEQSDDEACRRCAECCAECVRLCESV